MTGIGDQICPRHEVACTRQCLVDSGRKQESSDHGMNLRSSPARDLWKTSTGLDSRGLLGAVRDEDAAETADEQEHVGRTTLHFRPV